MKDFYYEKLLQAICFSDNPKIYLNEEILDSEFLKKVKEFLIECNNCSIISDKMKDNLLDLTDYLRYNGYPDLANEFIILINRADISYFCWYEFLDDEFEKRKIYRKAEFDIYNDNIIDDLFYSLEFDYTVLQSLLCDDETFESEFAPKLMLDEFYFVSCARLMEQIPKLFDNKKIYERISVIHSCNQKLKNEIQEDQKNDYKQILKRGKKLVNKVIK